MVKVSVEVRSGAAHFNVAVRAESIRRAVSIVGGHYPGKDIKVRFPIKPEGFFVRDTAVPAEIVEVKQLERAA